MLTNCPDKDGPDLDFGMAPLLGEKKGRKGNLLVADKNQALCYALESGAGKAHLATTNRKGWRTGWHSLGHGTRR